MAEIRKGDVAVSRLVSLQANLLNWEIRSLLGGRIMGAGGRGDGD